MKNQTLWVLYLLLILTSCIRHEKQNIDKTGISNYKVQITYSSFFNCGDYQKILVDNKWSEDALYKKAIKDFNLYTFNIMGNCKDSTRIDTLSTKLSIEQSDNIFKLANDYVNNYQIYEPNETEPRIIIMDGSDIKVDVYYQNMCKSVNIYHYDKMPRDLINLIDFITTIK
jgi:hypothetical protein